MTIKRQLKPDFSEGIDRKDLKAICQRFLTLVKIRLSRTRLAMTPRQQVVLDALPLLFHVNHPLLPGYVSRQTPCVVRHFLPDKETIRQAQRLSRSFRYTEVDNKSGDIISIFLMGSTGSLAHSMDSDLDVWLCYRNGLTKKQLTELELKTDKISQWAGEMGAEVHFFLMNAAAFRKGRGTATVDSEDCGTAQQYLLLDEFYRTSIWLAGAYPLWWLIPADQEENYQQLAKLLQEKRFIRSRDYIDFGGCPTIPSNEFVGAGMWQLYKGIDSPFKSILKLKLIETYARDGQESQPLCLSFKQAVFDDELDDEELDPYVMICRRIEASFSRHQQWRKLAMVRRSFYLKIGEKLSCKAYRNDKSWRRKVVEKLVKEWQFDDQLISYLDNRQDWKIDEVGNERRTIVNELTESYRFLSAYARAQKLPAAISARDINLLGRKLYATFQRKAGKIERVNPGIAPNLAEDSLSFHHLSGQALAGTANAWLLYRNLTTPADADFSPALKRSNSLVELVVWSYINELLANTTSVSLVAGNSAASLFELKHIIANLRSQLPLPMPPVTQQEYRDRVSLNKVLLFVNVGTDPMAEMTRRGLHKLTDHTDALGYASSRTNLVLTMDEVLINSWNEVMVQRYEAGAPLVQCLNNTLAALAEAEQFGSKLPAFSVYCYCPNRAEAIAKRVLDLFTEVFHSFFGHQTSALGLQQKKRATELQQNPCATELQKTRYLLQIEEHYFILQFEGKHPRFLTLGGYAELCGYLELPQPHYSTIRVDGYALKNDPLLVIFSKMRSQVVQVYLLESRDRSELLVMDECGSLIRKPYGLNRLSMQLGALYKFLYSVQERKQMRDTLDVSEAELLRIEFYKLVRGGSSGVGYVSDNLQVYAQQSVGDYIDIQAIGQFDQSGELCFSLYFEDREFSPVDYGKKVIEALAHHLDQRCRGVSSSPGFITDLSLPHSLAEDAAQLPTSLYLKYKLQLETRLAEARQR